MVTWSGPFMTLVSDVSSIVFSNSGITFVFQMWTRVFSLGPGDWEFGNLLKLCEPFWRSWAFRRLHVVLGVIGISTCATTGESLTVSAGLDTAVGLTPRDPLFCFVLRTTLVFGNGVSSKIGCAETYPSLFLLIWLSTFHPPTPLRNCYWRRLVYFFLGFCFYWCFPVKTCTGSALLPSILRLRQWSGFLVR